ncbi:MAG TPA: hypothetical protein VNI78_04700 [Vicinamibacterales bacterium]|nr:hypothetical protein [Vicinamibacterales bacterium]
MRHSEKDDRVSERRRFLRRVVVGSGTIMFVAADYERPELETLLGPRVAHAHPSGDPPFGRGQGWGRGWGPGGRS